jgi:hypothetical protein
MSLYDDAILCTDADLAAWEHTMPALGQKMGAYAGKRNLAKNFIAKQLIKRGISPDELATPSQLNDAAAFKELELIFRDLADKQESIAANKADHYSRMFEDELETVLLKLTSGQEKPATISFIPLYRA